MGLLEPLLYHLLHRGSHHPGLFRTACPAGEVRSLWKELVALQQREKVAQRLAEDSDVHRVGAVLLHHLREEEPLVPPRLYDQVLDIDFAATDSETVLAGCRNVLQNCTLTELRQIQLLVKFLSQLVRASTHLTEVPVASLAHIFAPLIARPPDNAYMSVRHLQGFGQLRSFVIWLVESSDELFQEVGEPLPEHVRAAHQASAAAAAVSPGGASSSSGGGGGHPCADVVNELSKATVQSFLSSASLADAAGDRDWNAPVARVHASRGHGEVFLRWHPRGRGRQTLAMERRRMVQACRALRMQIKRFEDTFANQHGHVPKGRERLPLSSTYAQYREWKKNIRDHAAGQVQALFRGFRLRQWFKRARQLAADAKHEAATLSQGAGLGVVAEAKLGGRADSRQLKQADQTPEAGMSELQQEKKRIKQQLKAFDANFIRTHGRMPSKSEKEPIRDLYELYHAVKVQIKQFEAQPQRQGKVNGHALRDLDSEKTQLHVMLQRFESDFERTHRRPVSTAADIAPVQADYDRYKELKRLLGGTRGSNSGGSARDLTRSVK